MLLVDKRNKDLDVYHFYCGDRLVGRVLRSSLAEGTWATVYKDTYGATKAHREDLKSKKKAFKWMRKHYKAELKQQNGRS